MLGGNVSSFLTGQIIFLQLTENSVQQRVIRKKIRWPLKVLSHRSPRSWSRNEVHSVCLGISCKTVVLGKTVSDLA